MVANTIPSSENVPEVTDREFMFCMMAFAKIGVDGLSSMREEAKKYKLLNRLDSCLWRLNALSAFYEDFMKMSKGEEVPYPQEVVSKAASNFPLKAGNKFEYTGMITYMGELSTIFHSKEKT